MLAHTIFKFVLYLSNVGLIAYLAGCFVCVTNFAAFSIVGTFSINGTIPLGRVWVDDSFLGNKDKFKKWVKEQSYGWWRVLSSYKIIIKLYLYIYLESMPFNSRNKGNGNKAICILCSDPSRSSTLFFESNEIQNDWKWLQLQGKI